MKKRIVLLFILFLNIFCFAETQAAQNRPIVVVIPSSNNKEWVKRNLDSVFAQSYSQFRVIYIDDASEDGTGSFVEEYVQKNGLQERMVLLKNNELEGSLFCLSRAISLCIPDEIIVHLEGSDWLSHRDALADLNDIYADPDVWLTYGQTCSYPSYASGNVAEISQDIIEKNDVRTYMQNRGFTTFYAGLFSHVKKSDLFWPDMSLYFPLLELSGHHSKHISKIHCVHNALRDKEVDLSLIRAKEKYTPLTHFKQQVPLKKVYITPGMWGELFSISNPLFNRDNCLEVLYRLRETARQNGYELQQVNDLDSLQDFEYLVVFDVFLEQLGSLSRYPKEKKILFLWEPPSVISENYNLDNHRDFTKVYTWHDGLVDNKKYFKFFYPVIHPMIENTIDYASKNLCTLIACNKSSWYPGELYSERLNLIHFYEHGPYEGFTLFGKGWPYTYRNYGGPIDTKVNVLKSFRFCYAYENVCNIPGYVTEKIFDCFHAGTVPIYWGAPNVADYIPKSCFIAREDFPDDEALYFYLRNMDEGTYQQYVNNIRAFLNSKEARLYSQQHFISIFMNLISTGSL